MENFLITVGVFIWIFWIVAIWVVVRTSYRLMRLFFRKLKDAETEAGI